MPVDGGGGNTDDSGDDTELESDKSSNVSQPSDVALALLGGDGGGEGGLTPHGSDDEIAFIPIDAGVADVGHVDHDGGLIAFPPPAPAPLPDPVLDGAPDWDKGIQEANVGNKNTKCMLCSLVIDKGTPRLALAPFKTVIRFLHPHCAAGVPAATKAHSNAMLQHQQHTVGGVHMLALTDAIESAIALL